MKEFVEKMIERLEEERHPEILGGWPSIRIERAIEIVNQLAEEYVHDINVGNKNQDLTKNNQGLDKLSQEPKTRIEHIRSMSVEELADVIMESNIDIMIEFCQNSCGECENIPESECRKCLIKYLNSPVEQKKVIPTRHFTERFNKVL